MTGIVIRVTGSWHDIRLDDGTVLPSRIIGRLRLDDIRTTNPVGVGDRVEVTFEQDQPGQGVITEVLPGAITSSARARGRSTSCISWRPMSTRPSWSRQSSGHP